MKTALRKELEWALGLLVKRLSEDLERIERYATNPSPAVSEAIEALTRARLVMEAFKPSRKVCYVCKDSQPIEQFYFHARRDRHEGRCRECCRKIANGRYRGGILLKRRENALQEKT